MASDFALNSGFWSVCCWNMAHWCYRRISMMICHFSIKTLHLDLRFLVWGICFFLWSSCLQWLVHVILQCLLHFTSSNRSRCFWSGCFCQTLPKVSRSIYLEGVEDTLFSWPLILGWMLNGVLSSLVIFFLTTNSVFNYARLLVCCSIMQAAMLSNVMLLLLEVACSVFLAES